jgi:hypothetical protein
MGYTSDVNSVCQEEMPKQNQKNNVSKKKINLFWKLSSSTSHFCTSQVCPNSNVDEYCTEDCHSFGFKMD